MKKVPLLLILLLALTGCAHHEDHPENPYVAWDKQKERDEDHQFFYGGWLDPNANDPENRAHKMPGINASER